MSSPKPPTPKQRKHSKKKNTTLSPWAWVFVVLGGLVLLGSLWGAYKFYMWWNPPAKYERDFSLQWDEEVKLHDGRMIVVNIKRKFRRQYLHLEYERVWYLGTEISFDAGEPWGRYTRYFQGYDVGLIDTYNGKWYFKLNDATPGGGPNPRIVSERYPYMELNSKGIKALNGPQELPHFPLNNVMRRLTSVESLSHFDGQILSWEKKIDFLKNSNVDYKVYMNVPLRDGMSSHVGITKHIGVQDDN